jgi:hypothetical protein
VEPLLVEASNFLSAVFLHARSVTMREAAANRRIEAIGHTR